MSIRKPMAAAAVIAAALAVGVVVSGVARADRRPQIGDPGLRPGERTGVVSHRATEDPQQVRDYWTPDRMRKAHPAPMPSAGD